MWAYALLTFAKFEMDEQIVRIRKMRVKRILCGLVVASIIVTLFAASALATEPSGYWPGSWSVESRNLKNEDHYGSYNPMYTYYNYGSWFHDAWCSTELSVPTNGVGYVYAEIRDTNGNTLSKDLEANGSDDKYVTDGMLKLPAVYGEVNGAQFVRFAARQTVGINIDRKRVRWNNNN